MLQNHYANFISILYLKVNDVENDVQDICEERKLEKMCVTIITGEKLEVRSDETDLLDLLDCLRIKVIPVWSALGLFVFLMSSSEITLSPLQVPRLKSDNFTCCHTEKEWGGHDLSQKVTIYRHRSKKVGSRRREGN